MKTGWPLLSLFCKHVHPASSPQWGQEQHCAWRYGDQLSRALFLAQGGDKLSRALPDSSP